mmetsp:Transcript_34011/g.79638  ORF Transcript_34011/g.79638 Transcript_34011/m.79638 type:complete len:210 (-) Transcript_34011:50-679(-)
MISVAPESKSCLQKVCIIGMRAAPNRTPMSIDASSLLYSSTWCCVIVRSKSSAQSFFETVELFEANDAGKLGMFLLLLFDPPLKTFSSSPYVSGTPPLTGAPGCTTGLRSGRRSSIAITSGASPSPSIDLRVLLPHMSFPNFLKNDDPMPTVSRLITIFCPAAPADPPFARVRFRGGGVGAVGLKLFSDPISIVSSKFGAPPFIPNPFS